MLATCDAVSFLFWRILRVGNQERETEGANSKKL